MNHAINEWRRRLSACVDAEGGHFLVFSFLKLLLLFRCCVFYEAGLRQLANASQLPYRIVLSNSS